MLLGLILPGLLLLLVPLVDLGLVAWALYQLGHDRLAAWRTRPSWHLPHFRALRWRV